MRKVRSKVTAIRGLAAAARPRLPLILDSLRLQKKPYRIKVRETGLIFDLSPQCGDWFTFYECCVRKDYFSISGDLQNGASVLDIGGNFGAFAMMAAHMIGPTGRVHCYEPSPVSHRRIKDQLSVNGLTSVDAFNAAVGGTNGSVTLHVHTKSALNSTLTEVDVRIEKGVTSIDVEMISISDALSQLPGNIAIAKIDCEGSEYEIMDSIADEDLQRVGILAMETHAVPGRSRSSIFEKLSDNKFKIFDGNPFFAVNPGL